MKVLTILVPVYNTEKYINRCLDSLVLESVIDDIEILVVNDGSKDGSVEIVKRYAEKYPQSVVLIDKENGGHGSTINKGIECATGKYFRVLDSDDWFNILQFEEFVNRLKKEDADLVVCNYRKEFIYNAESEYLRYKDLEENTLYNFEEFDLKKLNGEYFVMATSTYKTNVLRKSGLKLLEKTFYVDMQYNIVPISEVKTFVYYKLDIYRYFIGRKDQSMNMNNFVKNQNHHKMMITWLINYYTEIEKNLSNVKKAYLEMILIYTLNTHYAIYCDYEKDYKKAYAEVTEFDAFLQKTNPELYEKSNCIGYIRYNRKTKFKSVKYNFKYFRKLMVIARKLKG